MTSALIHYDAACRALADAKSIDEVKDLHDKAEAMRAYGRQAKNKTLEIDAAEIRLRAERRLGELIGDQKHGGGLATGAQYGGRAKIDGSRAEPSIKTPTLAELGIDKKLSSRAQKIAAIPEATFEAQMASWRERAAEMDERITVNFIREHEKAQRREANQAPVEGGGRVEDLLELVKKGVTFSTIYADPPWEFETWSERGQDRSAIQHYRVSDARRNQGDARRCTRSDGLHSPSLVPVVDAARGARRRRGLGLHVQEDRFRLEQAEPVRRGPPHGERQLHPRRGRALPARNQGRADPA